MSARCSAWSIHLKPAGYSGRLLRGDAIPIVIGNTMYIGSPYGEVIALDATSGAEKWRFQLPNNDIPAKRGIAYWPGGGGRPASIVFGSNAGALYSIDAATGRLNDWFGDKGIVNTKTPEVMQTGMNVPYSHLSSPTIFKNLIITGAGTGEGPGGSNGGSGPAGDTRAWDATTGKLVWTFHTVPRPGEFGYDTWGGESAKNRSGVNVWGHMSLDAARGILYMPLGGPEQRSRRHRPSRRQPVLVVGGRGRCEHRQVSLAFPTRAPRCLGLRHAVGSARRRPATGRRDDSRAPRRQQDRAAVHAQPRHRQADLRRRRASRAEERRARRAGIADATVPGEAGAAGADDDLA